jgi:hypothetical protein
VQASPSLAHPVGQVEAGSQVSPASTIPFGQVARQSESVAVEHPAGQQRSPPPQAVTFTCEQVRLQLSALPWAMSSVQGSPSAHDVGQAPAWPAVMPRSQVSARSRTPFPQRGAQSESLFALHPAAQHPSPLAQTVID